MSRSRLLGMAAPAAMVLVLLGAAQTPPGRSALRHAGLTERAEPYTELAFARPSELPERLPSGRTRLTVPFTLHNAEGAPRDYAWSIEALDGERRTVLARGQVRTAAGQRASVERRLAAPCRGERTRVEVRLARPAESIGFWAQCR
ncbi:MAG TPA: hypothetical protein VGJ32_17440 [Solirubrobacteraceae bacterium]|jgi:hypothetical protein